MNQTPTSMLKTTLFALLIAAGGVVALVPSHAGSGSYSSKESDSKSVIGRVIKAIEENPEKTLEIVQQATAENPDMAGAIVDAAVGATDATGQMVVAIVEAASLGLGEDMRSSFLTEMSGLYPDVSGEILSLIPGEMGGNNIYLAGKPPIARPEGIIYLVGLPGYLGGGLPFVVEPEPPTKPKPPSSGSGGGGGGGGHVPSITR